MSHRRKRKGGALDGERKHKSGQLTGREEDHQSFHGGDTLGQSTIGWKKQIRNVQEHNMIRDYATQAMDDRRRGAHYDPHQQQSDEALVAQSAAYRQSDEFKRERERSGPADPREAADIETFGGMAEHHIDALRMQQGPGRIKPPPPPTDTESETTSASLVRIPPGAPPPEMPQDKPVTAPPVDTPARPTMSLVVHQGSPESPEIERVKKGPVERLKRDEVLKTPPRVKRPAITPPSPGYERFMKAQQGRLSPAQQKRISGEKVPFHPGAAIVKTIGWAGQKVLGAIGFGTKKGETKEVADLRDLIHQTETALAVREKDPDKFDKDNLIKAVQWMKRVGLPDKKGLSVKARMLQVLAAANSKLQDIAPDIARSASPPQRPILPAEMNDPEFQKRQEALYDEEALQQWGQSNKNARDLLEMYKKLGPDGFAQKELVGRDDKVTYGPAFVKKMARQRGVDPTNKSIPDVLIEIIKQTHTRAVETQKGIPAAPSPMVGIHPDEPIAMKLGKGESPGDPEHTQYAHVPAKPGVPGPHHTEQTAHFMRGGRRGRPGGKMTSKQMEAERLKQQEPTRSRGKKDKISRRRIEDQFNPDPYGHLPDVPGIRAFHGETTQPQPRARTGGAKTEKSEEEEGSQPTWKTGAQTEAQMEQLAPEERRGARQLNKLLSRVVEKAMRRHKRSQSGQAPIIIQSAPAPVVPIPMQSVGVPEKAPAKERANIIIKQIAKQQVNVKKGRKRAAKTADKATISKKRKEYNDLKKSLKSKFSALKKDFYKKENEKIKKLTKKERAPARKKLRTQLSLKLKQLLKSMPSVGRKKFEAIEKLILQIKKLRW